MQATSTGVGPRLREAREALGLTLPQASRDTKIRVGYLEALEREEFSAIRGEVYARGFLRTYASYLGLDPEPIVDAYTQRRPARRGPTPPPVPQPVPSKAFGASHRSGNWRLALVLTAIAVAGLAAAGMFTGGSSPAPATPSGPARVTTAPGPVVPDHVTVAIVAKKPVRVLVVVDGKRAFGGTLYRGNDRGFSGESLIHVQASCGNCLLITVNDHPLETPGVAPFEKTFGPQDFRDSPSANNG